jgi:DNA-binding NarL/FixJ family response regulator
MEATLSPSTDAITIAIVEDEAIAREGFAMLLAQEDDFDVITSVPDLSETSLLDADADVILMDARLIAGRGTGVPPSLTEHARRARIIATRVSLDRESLSNLAHLGVSALVLKNASFADVVSTIRAVASAREAAPGCLVDGKRRTAGATAFDMLTAREREIALLIACGKNNREIAEDLNISPHTANAHVRNIMEKLAVHSRLQIAIQANRERWTLWGAKRRLGTAERATWSADGFASRARSGNGPARSARC